MKGNYKRFNVIFVAALFWLMICTVNILIVFMLKGYHIDVTTSREYSLSKDTLDFLEQNNVPVSVRFYQSSGLSDKNKQLYDYALYIKNLLQDYQKNSHGLIDVSWIEVEPFQSTQASAQQAGLEEFDLKDGNKYLYLGASFTLANGVSKVIPQFVLDRKNVVEDDITRLLSVLTTQKKITIGVLSPFFDIIKDRNNFMHSTFDWPFVQALKKSGFNVVPLFAEALYIPDDIDAVLVFYPSKYDVLGIYALDQYLVRGGKAFVFLDSFSEERFRGQDEFVPYESGILPLLDNWGVFYYEDQLVGNNIHNRDLILEKQVIKYPFWMSLTDDNLKKHPVMKKIDKLYFNHGSFFSTVDISGIETETLLSSDLSSGIMDANKITQLSYDYLMSNYQQTEEEYPLAVVLKGRFSSLFDGPIISGVDVLSKIPQFLSISEFEGKVVLVGDSDMAAGFLWQNNYKPEMDFYQTGYSSDNFLFIRNVFDYLTESGYFSVGKKKGSDHVSIVDVLANYVRNYYEQDRENALQALKKVKEDIEELKQKISQAGVSSIQLSKQLESLKRQEIQRNNDLDKVFYYMFEGYQHSTTFFFIVMIIIFPLLLGLVLWGSYAFYQKYFYSKFERCLK